MWANAALILGAYLLGLLPHLAGLAKLRGIELEGDLHLSLWQTGGRLVGTLGILGEFAKGVIVVLVARSLGFGLLIVVLAGLAVVIGQMWPVFQRFNGEKGNTTGVGVILAFCFIYGVYLAFIVCALIMIAGFFIRTIPRVMKSGQTLRDRLSFGGPVSNSLPLGMITGFASLPLVSWLTQEPDEIIMALLCMFVLIVIRRLTAGLIADLREPRTGIGSILFNRLLYDRSYY